MQGNIVNVLDKVNYLSNDDKEKIKNIPVLKNACIDEKYTFIGNSMIYMLDQQNNNKFTIYTNARKIYVMNADAIPDSDNFLNIKAEYTY